MKKTLSFFFCFVLAFCGYVNAFATNEQVEILSADCISDNLYNVILPEEIPVNDADCDELVINETKGFDLAGEADTLPASFDSRTTGCIPPVKDQGASGTCWAFATMVCLEAYDIKHGYKTLNAADYSESHLTWYSENTVDASGTRSLDGQNVGSNAYYYGGNWMIASNTLTEMSGINKERDYPFGNWSDISNHPFNDETDRYAHTSGRLMCDSILLLNSDDIKTWIVENGAVSIGYASVSSGYMYKNSNGDYSYYTGDKTVSDINHNVAIIGWDDNWSTENFNPDHMPSSDGAWLVRDSWGDYRFNDGYYWLSYEETSLGNFVGFTTKSDEDYINNYSYTSSYFGTYLNSATNVSTYTSATIGNVYTADTNELVDAVNFWTVQENLTAKIKIYTNLPANYSNPAKGTLAATYTYSIPEIGCHTITLPTSVAVNASTKFAVCVELSSTNSSVMFPVENNNVVPCVVHEKESFVKLGTGWYDITSFGYGNLYIKAQTKCNHNYVITCNCDCDNPTEHYSYKCSQCGDVSNTPVESTYIDEFQIVEQQSVTCTTDGYYRVHCALCNTYFRNVLYPATDHNYVLTQTIEPTIFGGGKKIYRCTRCDDTYTEYSPKVANNTIPKRIITIDELFSLIIASIVNLFKNR